MSILKELQELESTFITTTTSVEVPEEEAKQYVGMSDHQLPSGIVVAFGEGHSKYRRVITERLTAEQISRYIPLKQLETLITIKKCLIFFVALTLVGVIGGIVSVISTASRLR